MKKAYPWQFHLSYLSTKQLVLLSLALGGTQTPATFHFCVPQLSRASTIFVPHLFDQKSSFSPHISSLPVVFTQLNFNLNSWFLSAVALRSHVFRLDYQKALQDHISSIPVSCSEFPLYALLSTLFLASGTFVSCNIFKTGKNFVKHIPRDISLYIWVMRVSCL